MCACQVNSLEIDGRTAADGARSRAEQLCLHPFLPAAVLAGGFPCRQRGAGSRGGERSGVKRPHVSPVSQLRSAGPALEDSAGSSKEAEFVDFAGGGCSRAASSPPGWESPGEAGESPGEAGGTQGSSAAEGPRLPARLAEPGALLGAPGAGNRLKSRRLVQA